jgi:cold shock CspA family protein
MSSQKEKGVVKFLNKKGYGFIWIGSAMTKPENQRTQQEELFFHVSCVLPGQNNETVDLRTGDEVEFEVADGDRGQTAININRLKAVFEKNKTVLPATNVTIGIKKVHIPILAGIFKDLLGKGTNDTQKNLEGFNTVEIEAMEEFYKTLENAENKMNYSAPPAVVKNNPEPSKANGKKKNNSATV